MAGEKEGELGTKYGPGSSEDDYRPPIEVYAE